MQAEDSCSAVRPQGTVLEARRPALPASPGSHRQMFVLQMQSRCKRWPGERGAARLEERGGAPGLLISCAFSGRSAAGPRG